MVFNDAPELRTDVKLLIRFEGITEEGLLKFRRLAGFTYYYDVIRNGIETNEFLYFEASETLTDMIKQQYDTLYLFGELQVLQNFKVNIVSLHTAFLFEWFCWQIMPAKLKIDEAITF